MSWLFLSCRSTPSCVLILRRQWKILWKTRLNKLLQSEGSKQQQHPRQPALYEILYIYMKYFVCQGCRQCPESGSCDLSLYYHSSWLCLTLYKLLLFLTSFSRGSDTTDNTSKDSPDPCTILIPVSNYLGEQTVAEIPGYLLIPFTCRC